MYAITEVELAVSRARYPQNAPTHKDKALSAAALAAEKTIKVFLATLES